MKNKMEYQFKRNILGDLKIAKAYYENISKGFNHFCRMDGLENISLFQTSTILLVQSFLLPSLASITEKLIFLV